MTIPMRDLSSPEPWTRSMERSLHRRAILPEARKRLNRRRRASTALTTLMVAGPAGQVLAATGAGREARGPASSPVDRAIAGQPGAALLLKLGSTGSAVEAVQERLAVAVDGIYGPVTEGAVRDFQSRTRILVDGVVGPVTWTELFGLGQAAAGAGATDAPVAVIVRERSPAPVPSVRTVAPDADRATAGPAVVRDGTGTRTGGGERAQARPRALPRAKPAPAPEPPTARRSPTPPPAGACSTLRLATPVKGLRTSPFGPRWGRNHDGIDIAAATGTAIRAAECGVVTVSSEQGGYGNMVCVQHSDRFETCYAHMSSFAVNAGDAVRRGQVIGYVGCTGSCTGPHLHFETRVDGQAQNPDTYLRGAPVPGTPKLRAAAARPASTTTTVRRTVAKSGWQTPASVPRSGRTGGAHVPRSEVEPAPGAPETPLQQSAPVVPQEPVAGQAPAPVQETPAPVIEQVVPVPVEQAPPAGAAPAPAPVAESQPAPVEGAAPVVEPPAGEQPTAESTPPAETPAEPEPIEAPPAPAEPEPVEPELPTPAAQAPPAVEGQLAPESTEQATAPAETEAQVAGP